MPKTWDCFHVFKSILKGLLTRLGFGLLAYLPCIHELRRSHLSKQEGKKYFFCIWLQGAFLNSLKDWISSLHCQIKNTSRHISRRREPWNILLDTTYLLFWALITSGSTVHMWNSQSGHCYLTSSEMGGPWRSSRPVSSLKCYAKFTCVLELVWRRESSFSLQF